jgi:hypothetical protein
MESTQTEQDLSSVLRCSRSRLSSFAQFCTPSFLHNSHLRSYQQGMPFESPAEASRSDLLCGRIPHFVDDLFNLLAFTGLGEEVRCEQFVGY